MYKIYLIFIILLTSFIQIKSHDSLIVETENGKIRGKVDKKYISFHSVPYAEPPVEKNRFETPKPIEKNWTEVLDGTKVAEPCLQWSHFIFEENRLSGNENCLYLNIHTPSLNASELFPVIVFIHGGAFQYGTGNVFRPDLIMKGKDVVVVTIAYRLGPLGFLTTKDNNIPGNLGLKDQTLALKWIKRNIKNFGGDSDHITLTGFSAGGASVHFHILTKGIEDLITSAISFSGTIFCPWVLVNDAEEKAKKLASILNCPTENSNLLKTCLKAKPAEDIVKAVADFQFSHYFPFRIFGPVIESDFAKDAFLNEDPENLIKSNKIGNIAWIVAYTSEDGAYNAADLMQKSVTGEYIEEFWEKFDNLAPKALFYGETLSKNESKQYSGFLKQKYKIENTDTNLEKYFKIQKMFTNELFAKGSIKAIKLHKEFGNSPVFAYVYDNPSPRGIGNLISQREDIDFGCTHGDDVFLMFNVPHRDRNTPFRDDELQISEKFLTMLKTFAGTGLAKYGDTRFPENKKNEKIEFLKITKNSATIEEFGDECF